MERQNFNNKNVTALVPVVLLAGFSSRMGVLKQHLEYKGKTFLMHIIDKLRAIKDFITQPYIFVGQANDNKSKDLVITNEGMWLVNNNPELGMISSILIALDYLTNIFTNLSIILWPIDFALVELDTLTKLVETFYINEGRKFIVPSYNLKRGHPVIIPSWASKELYLVPHDVGARWLFNKYDHEIEYVVVDDKLCVKNVNTPADYKELLDSIKI